MVSSREESAVIAIRTLVKILSGWGINKAWALKVMLEIWEAQEKPQHREEEV